MRAWAVLKVPSGTCARQIYKSINSILNVHFDSRGIMHRIFSPPQVQTLNWELYCHGSKCLREDIRWKRPYQWNVENRILVDDYLCWHRSLLPRELLAKKSATFAPSYSPDVATARFRFPYKRCIQLYIAVLTPFLRPKASKIKTSQ